MTDGFDKRDFFKSFVTQVTVLPDPIAYAFFMDSTRVKLLKLGAVCLLCAGIVTAIVLLVQWLGG